MSVCCVQFSDYFTGYFNGQYWLWWIFLLLGKHSSMFPPVTRFICSLGRRLIILFILRRSPAVLQGLRQLPKGPQHVGEHGHLPQNAPLLPLLKKGSGKKSTLTKSEKHSLPISAGVDDFVIFRRLPHHHHSVPM